MKKAILFLVSILCFLATGVVSGTARADKARPSQIIDNNVKYKIFYYDYIEDRGFRFGDIKEPLLTELNNAIGLEIKEIQGALDDPSSYLRETIAVQKMKAILISIDLSLDLYAPGDCAPYVYDDILSTCSYSMYIRVFKNRICISQKDEIIALASKEITDPSCSPEDVAHQQGLHLPKFSIPGHLNLKP